MYVASMRSIAQRLVSKLYYVYFFTQQHTLRVQFKVYFQRTRRLEQGSTLKVSDSQLPLATATTSSKVLFLQTKYNKLGLHLAT